LFAKFFIEDSVIIWTFVVVSFCTIALPKGDLGDLLRGILGRWPSTKPGRPLLHIRGLKHLPRLPR
jgi:hypothetical protein